MANFSADEHFLDTGYIYTYIYINSLLEQMYDKQTKPITKVQTMICNSKMDCKEMRVVKTFNIELNGIKMCFAKLTMFTVEGEYTR